jgi:hypothetical protein
MHRGPTGYSLKGRVGLRKPAVANSSGRNTFCLLLVTQPIGSVRFWASLAQSDEGRHSTVVR